MDKMAGISVKVIAHVHRFRKNIKGKELIQRSVISRIARNAGLTKLDVCLALLRGFRVKTKLFEYYIKDITKKTMKACIRKGTNLTGAELNELVELDKQLCKQAEGK